MVGDRIEDPQIFLKVNHRSGFVGVPVAAAASFDQAKSFLCRTGQLLPDGDYSRVAEDSEVALYQPVRFNVRWTPSIRWVCYKIDLRRRYDIYSKTLPINTGTQSPPRRPTIHHNPPARDAFLWCYMRLPKFKTVLSEGGLILTRANLFLDKTEGTLRPANMHYRKKVYSDNQTMADAGYLGRHEFERIKRWTYVSCWRLDNSENDRCWQEYVGNEAGIALVTTYGRLAPFVSTMFCAGIEYEDEAWIPEGNTLYPFTFKHRHWKWEQEFRIIEQQFPTTQGRRLQSPDAYDCSQENPDLAMMLKVNLNALLLHIVVGPKTTRLEKIKIQELLQRGNLSVSLSESVFC